VCIYIYIYTRTYTHVHMCRCMCVDICVCVHSTIIQTPSRIQTHCDTPRRKLRAPPCLLVAHKHTHTHIRTHTKHHTHIHIHNITHTPDRRKGVALFICSTPTRARAHTHTHTLTHTLTHIHTHIHTHTHWKSRRTSPVYYRRTYSAKEETRQKQTFNTHRSQRRASPC